VWQDVAKPPTEARHTIEGEQREILVLNEVAMKGAEERTPQAIMSTFRITVFNLVINMDFSTPSVKAATLIGTAPVAAILPAASKFAA
jgi:hypothetical protein